MKDRKDRVMLAHNLLRRSTFKNVIKDLNSKNVKNVVIIGGSHSGFSAAWMLMNGPADVLRNSHVKPSCQI
jgi:ribulose 1,5-bisphosphate synthetase/thiazole synthase